MLDDVRQRLLHDAVGGEVEPGGQLAPLALDRELDRHAGAARALDQRVELAQRRLRRVLGVLVGVQHAEQRAHLGERLAPGALDQLGGGDRARRVALEDPPRAAGLDDHHRDRVRDDVVHLARDPAALVGDRALGLRLALLVRAHGGLVQLGGEPRAAADGAAGEQEQRAERRREEDVARDERRRSASAITVIAPQIAGIASSTRRPST